MAYVSHSSVTKVWYKMPAYSWQYNPKKKDIEGGDKMQRFGERPMPHPLTFEVQNIKTRRISHCGVLEFSAEQATAFMPQWMMLNLGLEEGQEVQLKLKELPLATALVLQPLKYTFAEIATPKIALEHALSSFTCLTAGDTISIRVGHQTHELTVSSCQPESKAVGAAAAVCVVGAHLEVDFLPPLEVEPESDKPLELVCGAAMPAQTAAKGCYRYFRGRNVDAGSALVIEVQAHAGDPEIVVSTQTGKPTLTSATWKSISTVSSGAGAGAGAAAAAAAAAAGTKQIVINPDSLGFIVGWYFIGVFAYGTDAIFDVTMREAAPAASDGSSSSSSSARAAAGPSVGSLSSSDPNAKQCSNCMQYISAKSYSLHQAQCMRMNVYCAKCSKPIRKSEQATHAHCELCNLVLHPDALQKHLDLVHKSVACAGCGDAIPPEQMQQHVREECKMRPDQCTYCHLEMPHKLVFEHQQSCGAQTIPCELCAKPVSRKRMDIHLATDHGINLSYRPGDRSSMGAPAPLGGALTAADVAREQKALAAFRAKVDPAAPKPQQAPLSEDDQLAAAIAQSMADDDAALAAALAAEGNGSAAASSSAAAAPSAPAFVSTPSWLAAESVADDADSVAAIDASSVAEAEEDATSTWSDDEDGGGAEVQQALYASAKSASSASAGAGSSKPAGPRKKELDCPYCGEENATDEKLVEHMAMCEAVED